MATLLDIPPELLDTISEELLPYSIVSLVLTCKSIFYRSKPIIDRHNAYRAGWREASHRGPQRGDTLHLLYEITRDPLIPLYIESLHLWDRRASSEIRMSKATLGDSWDIRKDDAKMEAIKETIMNCKYFDEAGVNAEQWWVQIKTESNDLDQTPSTPGALTTILLLLPELKELGLPWWWTGPENSVNDEIDFYGIMVEGEMNGSMKRMLTYMIDRARQTSSPRSQDQRLNITKAPLAKLETIVPSQCAGNEEREGLQALEPFLPLPNLHTVYAVSGVAVDDGYTGIPFQWQAHNAPLDISLRRLELAYCCCDVENITALLSHMPHLEVFKYSHETKWHACGADWDAGAFVSELGKLPCGRSLKELVLRIGTVFGYIVTSAESFTLFTSLEALEIDFQLVLHRTPEGHSRTLVDIIPDKIAKVWLNVASFDCDPTLFGAFFSGLNHARQNRLRALETVIVRVSELDGNEKLAQCKAIAETQGIEWCSRKMWSTMDMGWEKEFRERFNVDVNADLYDDDELAEMGIFMPEADS